MNESVCTRLFIGATATDWLARLGSPCISREADVRGRKVTCTLVQVERC